MSTLKDTPHVRTCACTFISSGTPCQCQWMLTARDRFEIEKEDDNIQIYITHYVLDVSKRSC